MPDSAVSPEVTEQLRAIIDEVGIEKNRDLVARILATGVGLGLDDASRLDLKIVSAALTVMRAPFRLFAPYADIPKMTIFRSVRTRQDTVLYRAARTIAS